MSPRSRNKKEGRVLAILLHWFPVGTRLNPSENCMDRIPCQGTVHQLIPLSWGLPSAWGSSCSQVNALLDPGGSPGTKQERDPEEACMWWGCFQHAGDYAPQGTPKSPEGHREVTQVGEHACSCPPHQPQRGSCSISLSFPKVALTFLPSLSSLCFSSPCNDPYTLSLK